MAKDRTIIRTIHDHGGKGAEVQWTSADDDFPQQVDGYILVHDDGMMTFPFRNQDDEPFVLVADADGVRIVATEDQPPDSDARIVWNAADPYRVFPD